MAVEMKTLYDWFWYLPKLQVRLATGIFPRFSPLVGLFLCGALLNGFFVVLLSPVVLADYFGAFEQSTEMGDFAEASQFILTYVVIAYVLVAAAQWIIPWLIFWGVVLERVQIGTSYNHIPGSRLKWAREWAAGR